MGRSSADSKKAHARRSRASIVGSRDASKADCRIAGRTPQGPWGLQGRLAVAFVEAGLRHIASGRARALALLLSADFDSATLRPRLFRDCNYFVGKVVLTRRIVWFRRTDGQREQPKENAAWYLWEQPLLRTRQPPVVLYAPSGTPFLDRREPRGGAKLEKPWRISGAAAA
jgi:hypothetical protein